MFDEILGPSDRQFPEPPQPGPTGISKKGKIKKQAVPCKESLGSARNQKSAVSVSPGLKKTWNTGNTMPKKPWRTT